MVCTCHYLRWRNTKSVGGEEGRLRVFSKRGPPSFSMGIYISVTPPLSNILITLFFPSLLNSLRYPISDEYSFQLFTIRRACPQSYFIIYNLTPIVIFLLMEWTGVMTRNKPSISSSNLDSFFDYDSICGFSNTPKVHKVSRLIRRARQRRRGEGGEREGRILKREEGREFSARWQSNSLSPSLLRLGSTYQCLWRH